tara:strand:- start:362 stop:1027 length:666 start_codon:yes stop_codon:yes gene_type:complete
MVKKFKREIKKFYGFLENKKNFALTRFGDGEWAALKGSYKCIEWSTKDPKFIQELHDSFVYQDPSYYVGVYSPETIEKSKQPLENLTFATVFVNSNYGYFLSHYLPLFHSSKSTHFIGPSKKGIPFELKNYFGIPPKNAWKERNKISDFLMSFIDHSKTRNEIFLFSAGPLSNVLIHRLWKEFPNNIYMDIGSTLNPYIGSALRKYHNPQHENRKKVDQWT